MIYRPGLGFAGASQPRWGIPGGCPPTQDLPAAPRGGCGWHRVGSGRGTGGVCGGCPTAQLRLSPACVLSAPSPCSRAERWEDGSQALRRGWRTRHLTWHPPRDFGLVPLLPALAASPTGPAAAREPLLRPCISRQVLLNKYPIAMQGGSWVPPRFEWPRKPGPLRPSWNRYLSPVPTGTLCQPRPLAPCLLSSAAAAPAAP